MEGERVYQQGGNTLRLPGSIWGPAVEPRPLPKRASTRKTPVDGPAPEPKPVTENQSELLPGKVTYDLRWALMTGNFRTPEQDLLSDEGD